MSELKADKGKRDGSCNRTACQAPLKGRPQWYMRESAIHEGRLYYCDACARDFNAWDRRSGDPKRCTYDSTVAVHEEFLDRHRRCIEEQTSADMHESVTGRRWAGFPLRPYQRSAVALMLVNSDKLDMWPEGTFRPSYLDEPSPLPFKRWHELFLNQWPEDALPRDTGRRTGMSLIDYAELERRVMGRLEKLKATGEHYSVEVREIKLYATVDADGRADALYAHEGDSLRQRELEKDLTPDEWDSINGQIGFDREWE